MIGRQLPFFSLIVPFWLIWAFVGFRKMIEVWPAILVAGVVVRDPAVSRLELSRALAGRRRRRHRLDGLPRRCSCRVWQPADADDRRCRRARAGTRQPIPVARAHAAPTASRAVRRAWMPWIILSVFVFLWGTPQVRASLDGDLGREDSRSPACTSSCRRCRPSSPKPHVESRGLQLQPPVGDRHRHPARRAHLRPLPRLRARGPRAHVRAHDLPRPLLAAHHRLHAGDRLRHPLLGHRCDARSRASPAPAGSIRSSAR